MFDIIDGYDVQATRKQAREEAREEAIKEFRQKADRDKTEMVKEMLLEGEPLKKIIKYSKFTEEEIKEIEKTL